MSRRWIVLTDGYLTVRNAKTAHGVLRYSADPVAAVLDREYAGKTVGEVMPELQNDAPIVDSLRAAIDAGGNSLLLGVATPGGWIPEHWQDWLREAVDAGLEVANGLHRFLRDDEQLVQRAEKTGGRLWDVREPPADIPLCTGRALEAPQRIVATVGSDCAVGKMTASLELVAAAKRVGTNAQFIPTGQTGILIAGWGIAVDRVISDFTAGAAEKLVLDADPSSEVLVVEGQGGLWHPAYSGVTLSLLHGSAPQVLVLCHRAGHSAIEEPPYTSLPPLSAMIQTYEAAAATLRPAPVACVSLNSRGLNDDQARQAIAQVEEETGLPTGDVMRGDTAKLWAAVADRLS